MGFDSQANQGPDSREGSDAVPGGYRSPPGYGPPAPAGNEWQSPGYSPPPPLPPPPPNYGPPPRYGNYPPPPPPPPSYGYSGYGYTGGVAPRTDGTAIAVLILAIASFVGCPIVPAVIALAMIPSSRRTIVNSGGAVVGLGLLTAGKVIAWINVGLVGVVLIFVMIAAAVSSSSSLSNALSRFVTG